MRAYISFLSHLGISTGKNNPLRVTDLLSKLMDEYICYHWIIRLIKLSRHCIGFTGFGGRVCQHKN